MGTGWLLLILYIALSLKALAIRRDLKLNSASIAIICTVLSEVRELAGKGSWTVHDKRCNFGRSPSLSIFLVHESVNATLHFNVTTRHSLCELAGFRECEEGTYSFSFTRPAHYFDLKFLTHALARYERWMQSDPEHFEWFLYPPTGSSCSVGPKENISRSLDSGYKDERRMAERDASARYPILDY